MRICFSLFDSRYVLWPILAVYASFQQLMEYDNSQMGFLVFQIKTFENSSDNKHNLLSSRDA